MISNNHIRCQAGVASRVGIQLDGATNDIDLNHNQLYADSAGEMLVGISYVAAHAVTNVRRIGNRFHANVTTKVGGTEPTTNTIWADVGIDRNLLPAGSYIEVPQIATPATPASGQIRVYGKSDDRVYRLTDGGAEIPLGGSGFRELVLIIDGGGATITTGVKAYIPIIGFTGTITAWRILADASGSIVVDVWKDTYANFPPVVADTIAGTEKPTLSSAQKNEDTALSTWTTALADGEVLGFNVDSATTVQRVTLILKIQET